MIGANDDRFGPRFPDMSEAYNKEFRAMAKKVAATLKHCILKKVSILEIQDRPMKHLQKYVWFVLGGDAVGMSTVPEVIVASHAGMKVLGISCITNMAAGILDQPLSHEEVIETTEKVKSTFS